MLVKYMLCKSDPFFLVPSLYYLVWDSWLYALLIILYKYKCGFFTTGVPIINSNNTGRVINLDFINM